MKQKFPFLLLFTCIAISLLLFGFGKSGEQSYTPLQEAEFLGLFASAEQKWGLTPAVFGKMQTQLQNKIRVFAVYSDGTINRDLNSFTPVVDNATQSKSQNPESWGSWKNGESSKDGLGYVIFNWKDIETNDTVVVYPLPKNKNGYTLEGRYDMYVSLKDDSGEFHNYSHLLFDNDGNFKMKKFNRFLEQYDEVPYKTKDCGSYSINDGNVKFLFNDGRQVITTFSHILPKKKDGSTMIFLGGDHGFKKR